MKSIAVIGLGQFGYQLAIGLTQKGFDVLAIDKEVDIVSEIKDLVSQSMILDAIDEKAMLAVNIDNVDIAIVAIGTNIESSLLTTALLQRIGIQKIYVRAISPLQESILKSIGIKHVLNLEKDMGIQLANSLSVDGIGRYVEISNIHSLMEILVPKALVGKTLKSLKVRSRYRINIVGIKKRVATIDDNGDVAYKVDMTDVPDPNYPLHQEDILVVAGTDYNLTRFIDEGKSDD
jgi:trk system potassium uptake protein TrkA